MPAGTRYANLGIKRVILQLVKLDDLTVNFSPATTGLSATLGSGQGADYDDPAADFPHRIKIDSEHMRIVAPAVGDVITVAARAADGTAAGTHSTGVGNVKHLVPIDITFANAFNYTPQTQEITIAGDSKQIYFSRNLGMRGQIDWGLFADLLLTRILGAPKVTTNIPVEETWRIYAEGATYPKLQAQADLVAQDMTTKGEVYLRETIFSVSIQPRPHMPQNHASAATANEQLMWVAEKTTTDILGTAIPGVPSGGAYYSRSLLA